MSNFNHRICERCWFSRPENAKYDDLGHLISVRSPVCFRKDDPDIEPCCYCAHVTILGAFIRENPEGLACQRYGFHEKEEEE